MGEGHEQMVRLSYPSQLSPAWLKDTEAILAAQTHSWAATVQK